VRILVLREILIFIEIENQFEMKIIHSLFFIFRSYRDKTGKLRSFNDAAKPLYPLFWLFIISTIWAVHSPNHILDVDPRVFFMITGTIFSSFSVCKIVPSLKKYYHFNDFSSAV
jgi:hypothetical protein